MRKIDRQYEDKAETAAIEARKAIGRARHEEAREAAGLKPQPKLSPQEEICATEARKALERTRRDQAWAEYVQASKGGQIER